MPLPMKTRKINRTYKKQNPLLPFIVFGSIGTVLVILLIVVFTSFIVNDSKKKGEYLIPGFTDVKSSEESHVSSNQESSSKQQPKPVAFKDTVIPETAEADADYFKDAIFIGDSISLGLKAYGIVPVSNVVAEKNVSINSIINDKKVYYNTKNQPQTLFECIDEKNNNPSKIYILLGSNGIPGYSNEDQIEQYKTLLKRIKQTYKKAIIYVETVTPITPTAKGYTKEFTNAKIDDFNKKLEAMAKEMNVYLLKVNQVLKGTDGYLNSKYNAGDGIHISKIGHQLMYKYFKTHVVQQDKTIYPATK